MSKIIIDVFGSDNPSELIKGAADAVNAYKDIEIVLPGDADFIKSELKKHEYDTKRITVIDAKEIITNNESPTEAIRKKKNSSLVKGMERLRSDDDAIAMVCAGATGAALCGGIFIVGRMNGVDRPALAAVLPTENDAHFCLIDAGANTDCRPEYLTQFALLGSYVMKALHGIESPRVALLSNGTEEKKGNDLVHKTFELLKEMPNINFVGNMEARAALSGNYDVCVCDGFTGNILLKCIEGTATMMAKKLGSFLKKNAPEGQDMTFVKKSFDQTMKMLDYNSEGGAILLGCKKIIIKAHGAANARTIVCVTELAKKLSESGMIEKVQKDLAV